MNDLEKYFHMMAKRSMNKWSNYFNIYDAHFSRFRGTAVNVLEIGIGEGGSLQMWKWYFGSKSKIFGIDHQERKLFKEARIETFKCDQENIEEMTEILVMLPKIDIIIDDGGHTMDQQLATFQVVYPFISDTGIYLCEDIHSSFLPEFGGDTKRTFLAVMKKHIDQLTASRSQGEIPITDFSLTTDSMHFYNGVVVIEKAIKPLPDNLVAKSKHTTEELK